GCPDTIKAVVTTNPVPPPPDVRAYFYCQNQTAFPLSATALAGHLLQWYTAPTGGVASTSSPTPSTATLGVREYWVSQKQLFGCESPRVPVRVTVHGPVPITLAVNQDRQCFRGHDFVFTNSTANLASPYFEIQFGDGYRAFAQPGVPVSHHYDYGGAFRAKLVLSNTGVCSDTTGINIVVIPDPVAYIAGPPSICVGAVGAALSDSSLVPGSSLAQWWWNVGGVISNSPQPPLPSNAAGPVNVDLVVTNTDGCRSDTVHKVLPVHARPVAAFTFSGYCDNEPLQLRDASYQPPNTQGERLESWTWTADGNPLSNQSSPDVLLSGGTHRVALVVANNYGCTSDPADSSITLSAHPRIDVQADDSCAGRPMQFTAQVLSGLVRDWRWNLGTGWMSGGMQLRQTFLQPGIRLVQLIAMAPDGCRDTLRRGIPVIRNEAFAGSDTAATYGEAVQLDAHGDSTMRLTWSPADGLTDPASARPLALWPADIRYELYAVDRFGCESRSSILVRRYLGPELYVPSAFTPNADGRNDRLRVLPVGIRTLHYFAVYSRGGKLLYRGTQGDKGWDGTFEGVALGTQTLVWIAEGTDYKGQKVFRKGTATLLR
ncbi:MAG: T9SS type B sorting domain-containing protein, partial [Chitinophagaceae bacterium]